MASRTHRKCFTPAFQHKPFPISVAFEVLHPLHSMECNIVGFFPAQFTQTKLYTVSQTVKLAVFLELRQQANFEAQRFFPASKSLIIKDGFPFAAPGLIFYREVSVLHESLLNPVNIRPVFPRIRFQHTVLHNIRG